MIIYNVTVKVLKEISADWIQWMKEEHVPQLLQTGLFEGYQLCHLMEQDEAEEITYVVQYFLKDKKSYEDYIGEHAPEMRRRGLERFGNKFIAFRTVMEIIS